MEIVQLKKHAQVGYHGWKRTTGVICDKKISTRMKKKLYKAVACVDL